MCACDFRTLRGWAYTHCVDFERVTLAKDHKYYRGFIKLRSLSLALRQEYKTGIKNKAWWIQRREIRIRAESKCEGHGGFQLSVSCCLLLVQLSICSSCWLLDRGMSACTTNICQSDTDNDTSYFSYHQPYLWRVTRPRVYFWNPAVMLLMVRQAIDTTNIPLMNMQSCDSCCARWPACSFMTAGLYGANACCEYFLSSLSPCWPAWNDCRYMNMSSW